MSHRAEAVQLLTALLLGLLLLLSVAILQTRRGVEQVGNLRLLLRCKRADIVTTAAAAAANASEDGQRRSGRSPTLAEHRPQRPRCNRLIPGDHQSGGAGNITFNPAGAHAPARHLLSCAVTG
jgi:heme A synthase